MLSSTTSLLRLVLLSAIFAGASAHERARLEVYNVGGLTYTAYSSIQSLWSPIVAPTTGPFDRVLRYSNTSCALDTLEVVLPANDTTGGCGNATCAGSVVLLMGVPHDEWGVDLEGAPAVEGGCSVRIAAQRLATESGAAAVVVELPELPGEVTQEESDDLLRRISGAHAESFPNATSGALAPVVLLDLNGTAILYAELLTGNVTNATILADAYLHDCSCFTFHPILLALILMAWCTMLAVWVSNTWGRNRASATTLHRVIVVVPFLKVCLELITVGLWLSCPWQNSHSPWLFMGWLGVYTWYEASYFGVFILLAKGWCITRPSLQMHDILNAACLLCLLYIVVNTYVVVDWPYIWVAILVVYMLLLWNVLRDIRHNLLRLRAQLLLIRAASVNALTTPIYAKWRMYRSLWWITTLYAVLEGVVHVVLALTYQRGQCTSWVAKLLHEVMEIAIFGGLCWQFRARHLSPYFSLVAELATAGRPPPPIFSATADVSPGMPPSLDEAQLGGPGLRRWRPGMSVSATAPEAPPPLVVVRNPGDNDAGQDEVSSGVVMVATRVLPEPATVKAAPAPPPASPPPPPPPHAPPHAPPPASAEEAATGPAPTAAPVADEGEGGDDAVRTATPTTPRPVATQEVAVEDC